MPLRVGLHLALVWCKFGVWCCVAKHCKFSKTTQRSQCGEFGNETA